MDHSRLGEAGAGEAETQTAREAPSEGGARVIRRFFADGLHWMAIAGVIIGYAIFGLHTAEPTAPAPIVVEQVC